ncbi:MAG: tRNA (guanosine(46)-N7)-methyltransferase TrmB, partial [Anaerovoracaceae bacterium]
MRQRNIKNLEERLAENSSFLIEEPKNMKGRWREIFGAGPDCPVYLEIGCGKGKFILTRAENNPDACYIAVEGQANVILRAMEKAEAAELSNLRL